MVIDQWLSVEHHRLHTVENWPSSPLRVAALAAIHSAIAHLLAGTIAWRCSICLSRDKDAIVQPNAKVLLSGGNGVEDASIRFSSQELTGFLQKDLVGEHLASRGSS